MQNPGEGDRDPLFRAFAARHLEIKFRKRRERIVVLDERALRRFSGFLGPDARLSDVTVPMIEDYIGLRLAKVSKRTVQMELMSLGNMFKRAEREDLIISNPVRRVEKPTPDRVEAVWLEPGEAARLLTEAHDIDGSPHSRAFRHRHPLFAAFLHTGGRWGEVVGLLAEDVDFERDQVHFRPNSFRRLKRDDHRRWVPLWPDLKRPLLGYLEATGRTEGLAVSIARGWDAQGYPGRPQGDVEAGEDRPASYTAHVQAHLRGHQASNARLRGAYQPLHGHARAGASIARSHRGHVRALAPRAGPQFRGPVPRGERGPLGPGEGLDCRHRRLI